MTLSERNEELVRSALAVLVDATPIGAEFDELTETQLAPTLQRRSGVLAFSVAFLVVGLIGGLTLWATRVVGPPAVSDTFAAEPVPGQTVTYTIDLPGWSLAHVFEAEDGSGVSHTLFHDVEIEEVPQRFWVDSGSLAAERANTLQTLGIDSVGTIFVNGRQATAYSIQSEDDA